MKIYEIIGYVSAFPYLAQDIQDVIRSTTKLGEPLDWPMVVDTSRELPRLNPDYKLRSDWPQFSFMGGRFRFNPTFWVRYLLTGDSVRVGFDTRSKEFYYVGQNFDS